MRSQSPGAPEASGNPSKSRKDARAVVSLVARYRSPTTFEYANDECGDVSVGGMFIKSASPAETGTLLKLECETDRAEEALIKGVARVVWVRRENNEHGPSGMGVKFVKLDPGSRERIESLIQRLAAEGVQAESIDSIAPEQRALAQRGKPVTSRRPAEREPEPGERTTTPDPSHAGAHDRITPIKSVFETDDTTPLRHEVSEWAWRDRANSEPPQPANSNEEASRERLSARPPGSTGSVRPTAPRKSRFGLRGWLLLAMLILIGIVIADRRGVGTSTDDADGGEAVSPADPPQPPPSAAAPLNAPDEPAPEASARAAPAMAQPTAEPAELTARAAPEPAPEPSAAEEQPPPAPSEAADPGPGPTSPSVAIGEAKPSDRLPPPLIVPAAGQPSYVIDFVSRPAETFVTIDETTHLTTPATVNLGAMPNRIKISARKPGFRSSSIWFERSGFELKDGVQRRKVYLTLKPESAPP